LDGLVGKFGQDFVQVFVDSDPESAAAFYHEEDPSHTRPGLFAAEVDPVLAARRDSPKSRLLPTLIARSETLNRDEEGRNCYVVFSRALVVGDA
jgi:hypothetical protein